MISLPIIPLGTSWSILPNLSLNFTNIDTLDSQITFTRSSTATYFDQDGVMQTAEVDEPRFDHDPSTGESLGLLIEEQRTNLFTYSEQFDDAAWTKSNATITANTEVAPDGTTTMDTITDDATLGQHQINKVLGVTSGITYGFSIFAKKGTATYLRMAIGGLGFTFTIGSVNLATGQIQVDSATGLLVKDIGNGIYRITMFATATSTANGNFSVGITNETLTQYSGTGETHYIWGSQLEAGAFPTSYIKTEASQVTGTADNAQMTGTNFSDWYNQSEGTLYAEARSNAVRDSTDLFPVVFSVTDGTNNEVIRILHRRLTGNDNDLAVVVRDGGVVQAVFELNPVNLTIGQFYKSAVAYKLNDFAGSMDAGMVITDVSGTIPTVNRANIGGETGILNRLSGHIKRISYYPRRLTNEQLQALTS